MTSCTLAVPRLNDSLYDWKDLARLWGQAMAVGDGAEITFNFSQCDFLRPNAVVFLGGLSRLIQQRGGTTKFALASMRASVRANLEQNGFAYKMGAPVQPWKGNSIPFREDVVYEKTQIMNYLRGQWLRPGWVNMSEPLRNQIAGTLSEMFANAFEHSGSPVGVFSCGQFLPNRDELLMAVADFGVGIPSNVRLYTGQSDLTSEEALRWALTSGNSTSLRPGSHGLGFEWLKELVRINNGVLHVFTADGYARIDAKAENFHNFNALNGGLVFEGTIIQVQLWRDEKYYSLKDENDETVPTSFF